MSGLVDELEALAKAATPGALPSNLAAIISRCTHVPLWGNCNCDGFSIGHETGCQRKIVGHRLVFAKSDEQEGAENLKRAATAIQSLTAQVQDDHPEYVGSPVCKIASYNYCHEQALGLGYPAIDEALNALEDVTAQFAAERAKVAELVGGLGVLIEHTAKCERHVDSFCVEGNFMGESMALSETRALIERMK